MEPSAPLSRIGVWQTAFFGDVVLTLPLLQTLRRAHPGASIQLFVRKGLSGIFAGHPEYAVREFDKRGASAGLGAAWRYGRELAREGFDAWISPHQSLRSALVARAAAAPVRVGYSTPWWNRLAYTTTVDRRFGEGHECWRIARLAEGLGIAELENWPELRPNPDVVEQAGAVWRKCGLTKPVVGLHPGTIWPTKRWPAASFSRLLDMLVEQGLQVAVFGGPGEEGISADVLSGAKLGRSPAVVDFSGKLNIPELLAHISKLAVYVANDSGPMHAAWAMRVPVVALVGPTGGIGFDPQGANARMACISPARLPCRPCGTHGSTACPLGHHACMRDLSPEAVFGLVREALTLQSKEQPHGR